MLDLSRLPDWPDAIAAYRRGDARRLSKFINEHGVLVGLESETLAELLLSKPDARKATTASTEKMLACVKALMLKRRLLESATKSIQEHIEKVSERLKLRGWAVERIKLLIQRRYPWSTYPRKDTWKPETNKEIFARVAVTFNIDLDSVEKAHKRSKANNE